MIVTTASSSNTPMASTPSAAYNINNAEQAMDSSALHPVPGAVHHPDFQRSAEIHDKKMLEAIIRAADEILPDAILRCTSTTATENLLRLHQSPLLQFVMIDASHDPFEKNVAITKRVVDAARERHLRRGRARHARGVGRTSRSRKATPA